MFLKWIYQRNKEKFWDLVILDFYGDIPQQTSAPAIDFLTNARGTLEPFWSIQAYNIQRRSISDPKNAQIYQGFLLCIRTLLSVVSKGKVGIRDVEVRGDIPKETDPMKAIEDFVKSGKEKLSKKS